ncbi:hypothetical protein [Lentzea indica]|uniref:hypothetical protein n=1 Tax=Lentzea indica TaxID=2604800 RepID=UPI001FE28D69|nr:hypothetical protein [Lentzea indica]
MSPADLSSANVYCGHPAMVSCLVPSGLVRVPMLIGSTPVAIGALSAITGFQAFAHSPSQLDLDGF